MQHKEKNQSFYTVSQITTIIRTILEDEFPEVAIKGEISNFRPSSTGHYYFSLKDNDALISVVMFKSRIPNLNFKLTDGMVVIAKGAISVYPKRGTYQLICETVELAGEGDILALIEERKRKLQAEGLFDQSRKKPIPIMPNRIAVITSPTGAAIRDILRVLKRRNMGINLIILPAPVQGDDAAEIISQQLRVANKYKLGDVIIVTRGGGSLEDLLPFYEESVARAIAESEIPVISAVGHEIDVTISDLAADVRAPTPSAAAEMVSASREELLAKVTYLENFLLSQIKQRLERYRLIMNNFTTENLNRYFKLMVERYTIRLDDAREQIINSIAHIFKDKKHRAEIAINTIISSSPQETLRRGFAIVENKKTGKILRTTKGVSLQDTLNITLYQGKLDATVTAVENQGEKK